MADGKRPGGLIALAVLNFVFGGMEAIGALITFAGLGFVSSHSDKLHLKDAPPHAMEMAYLKVGTWALLAIMLIMSGVGYIKQKRFSGRTIGTAYGVLSLGTTLLQLVMGADEFDIGTIVFTVYPVLTLIMINTTFKDDLVN